MKISLKGKVVLVTGGSRGIGEGICRSLAEAEATLAIHFNSNASKAQALADSLEGKHVCFQADLGNTEDLKNLYEQVISELGRIDVLVNNAGIAISSDLEVDLNDWVADWDNTFAVNTRAQALLCKLCIPQFKEIGGGRIINISSRAAFRGDTLDYLAYGASKGAIPALTRSIARYCGKDNIKAFNIAPGFVRTDMAQDFMDQYGEAYALDDIALNQLTEPKDLGPMVTLLASGLADHATGTTIDINAASYVH